MATETITQADVATSTAQGQPATNTSLLGAAEAEAPASETADKQTDEVAPAADKPAQDKAEQPKPEPLVGEAHEFTVPEGETASPEMLTAYRQTVRELGLKPEQAQALLTKMAPAIRQQQEAAVKNARTQLQAEAKADPEFGGDKLKPNLALAKKAILHYHGEEFVQRYDNTGILDDVRFLRGYAKVGRDLSSDAFVSNGARRAAVPDYTNPKDLEAAFFSPDSK